jgi:hypothetical protein
MGNQAIEDKIKALFQKVDGAKGTNDEALQNEADSALALAQKLAAKHSIDLELLRQKDKAAGRAASKPIEVRLYLEEGPYTRSRANLACRIAMAMDLKVRLANDGSFVIFIGFPEDVNMAWQIFGLVAPQMLNSADRRVKRGEHKEIYDPYTRNRHVSAKTFKINYFDAYVNRVARRITMSREEAQEDFVLAEGVQQADGTVTGRVTGALVLIDRKTEVQKFFEQLYPTPKFKNGKERRQKAWQPPTANRDLGDARRAGSQDGARARITLGGDVGGNRRSLSA